VFQLVEKVRSRSRPFARTASSCRQSRQYLLDRFRKRLNPTVSGIISETVTLNRAAARCPPCEKVSEAGFSTVYTPPNGKTNPFGGVFKL
jgi:hypothetical protein